MAGSSIDSIVSRLRDVIRESSTEERDWEAIDGDTTFESLEFDSLSILDLLYDTEQKFGISLEAKDIIGVRTVGEIAALLAKRGA